MMDLETIKAVNHMVEDNLFEYVTQWVVEARTDKCPNMKLEDYLCMRLEQMASLN